MGQIGRDARGVDFSGGEIKIEDGALTRTDFTGAIFQKTYLLLPKGMRNNVFFKAKLQRAIINGGARKSSVLSETSFLKAKLQETSFINFFEMVNVTFKERRLKP